MCVVHTTAAVVVIITTSLLFFSSDYGFRLCLFVCFSLILSVFLRSYRIHILTSPLS